MFSAIQFLRLLPVSAVFENVEYFVYIKLYIMICVHK